MNQTSAREAILRAVRSARLSPVPAPDVAAAVRAYRQPPGDLATRFASAAQSAGARVMEGTIDCAPRLVSEAAPGARRVLSTTQRISGTIDVPEDPHLLADLDLLVCASELGVAENGAVWLPASRAGIRAALFLATSVVVLLDRDAIVDSLHNAYERLDIRAESFGAFIAGPSKTADIEQALVIGAHGPKQLTVILIDRTHLSAHLA